MTIIFQKFRSGLLLLAFSLILSFNAMAQTCGTPPTCEELGYILAESKCRGVASLRCPFDQTKYYCSAPVMVGDILYSDKSFASNLVPSKTPIGVVFDVEKRLAVALKSEAKYIFESDHGTAEIIDGISADDGKLNTKLILAFMEKSNAEQPYEIHYPAVEYAANYSTAGTRVGDWYLPSSLEGEKMSDNSAVLAGFKNANITDPNIQAYLIYSHTSSIVGNSFKKMVQGIEVKFPNGNMPVFPVIAF